MDDGGAKQNAALRIMEDQPVFTLRRAKLVTVHLLSALSVESLYRAKLTVFSFGAKGQAMSTQDKDIIALRQLGVAYINTAVQLCEVCA